MHFLNSGSDFLVSYLARVLSMAMRAKKSKKAVEAAKLIVMAEPEMPPLAILASKVTNSCVNILYIQFSPFFAAHATKLFLIRNLPPCPPSASSKSSNKVAIY